MATVIPAAQAPDDEAHRRPVAVLGADPGDHRGKPPAPRTHRIGEVEQPLVGCRVPQSAQRHSLLILNGFHVVVAHAEMVADFVDQDMADQIGQILAGLAPVIEDRPAVEKDHVDILR